MVFHKRRPSPKRGATYPLSYLSHIHYSRLSPGLRLAEMHSVQHVALRRGASNISGRHSRPLHRSLLHEKKGSSSKASDHASWVAGQVTL